MIRQKTQPKSARSTEGHEQILNSSGGDAQKQVIDDFSQFDG